MNGLLFFSDPGQLPVGYPEVPYPHLLNTLQLSGLGANGSLTSPMLNPLSPALTLPNINPAIMGFIAPHLVSGIASQGSYVVAGASSFIDTSTGSKVDDKLTSQAQSCNGVPLDSKLPMNSLLPSESGEGHSSQSTIPYVQQNAFIHPTAGGLPSLPINSVSALQSKASLLGLPTLPSVFSANHGAFVCNSPSSNMEANIVKEVIIPNELIGCIIGKGGSTVNEIRTLSRAQIKISNCEDASRERKITLCGPPQAVNFAYMLISNRSVFIL